MRARTINEEYSEHDQNLIDQARKTHYIDHYLVDKMADEAESEEAKEELKVFITLKYQPKVVELTQRETPTSVLKTVISPVWVLLIEMGS